MTYSKLLEFYARRGQSLCGFGINEAVLPLESSEVALLIFSELGLCILGGDIYKRLDEDSFNPTYENWYFEGNDVDESISKARTYLGNLTGEQLYVSFIVS